jgi:hypothetical protein
MDTYYEDFEVVHVLDDCTLIDAESYQRKYCARTRRLTPGHYVVTWPHETQRRRFDEHAEFQGPYTSCLAAWRVLDRLESKARSAPLPQAAPKLPALSVATAATVVAVADAVV